MSNFRGLFFYVFMDNFLFHFFYILASPSEKIFKMFWEVFSFFFYYYQKTVFIGLAVLVRCLSATPSFNVQEFMQDKD